MWQVKRGGDDGLEPLKQLKKRDSLLSVLWLVLFNMGYQNFESAILYGYIYINIYILVYLIFHSSYI